MFVGAGLSVFLITISRYTMVVFFGLVAAGCFYEYFSALANKNKITKSEVWTSMVLVGLLPILASIEELTEYKFFEVITLIQMILVIVQHQPLQFVFFYFIGIIWISPAILICIKYALIDPWMTIVVLIISLTPDITSTKTFEGRIGGILTSIFVSYLISFVYKKILYENLMILGLIYGVFGQISSLFDFGINVPGAFLALPVGHFFLSWTI